MVLLNAAGSLGVLQCCNQFLGVMAFYSHRPRPEDGAPTWDVFCLICGGPSCNPAKIEKPYFGFLPRPQPASIVSDLPHLSELVSNFGWLEDCIGIPEDNIPVALGLYDGQGDFELSGNRLFGPYPSYAQAERTPNKTYGLNCHRKCYQLLRDELGYKLRYQDIWPKLAAANDDSECLNSTYGGMTEYHEHLFACSYMDEDKSGWMILDPTENKRNAQRILTVWKDVPEARRPYLMTAVLCTLKRAARLAKDEPATKQTAQPVTREHTDNNQLWKSMARVPPAVLRSIIERAYFHPDFLGYTCRE